MKFKLTADIIQDPLSGFTAWIREIRGVVAHGDTIEEARDELFKALQIKLEMQERAFKSKLSDNKKIVTESFNFEAAL